MIINNEILVGIGTNVLNIPMISCKEVLEKMHESNALFKGMDENYKYEIEMIKTGIFDPDLICKIKEQ